MLIYKDKKGQEKYIIAGQVFPDMDSVMNYLIVDKQLTPTTLEAYLNKHTMQPTINKKQAIQLLRDTVGMSVKKATSLLD